MTKEDGILNYENPKYSPVDDFRKFYEIQSAINPEKNKPETRSEIEVLRDLQKSNPEGLSANQNMILGYDDLRIAKEVAMENSKNPSPSREGHSVEMISNNSPQFQELSKNITEIQRQFDTMKDNGGFL